MEKNKNQKKRPPPLRGVELVCPKCHSLLDRRDLPFLEGEDGCWYAQSVANCVSCAIPMDFRLKVDPDGCVYSPKPGSTGDVEWQIFGYMNLESGLIATLEGTPSA